MSNYNKGRRIGQLIKILSTSAGRQRYLAETLEATASAMWPVDPATGDLDLTNPKTNEFLLALQVPEFRDTPMKLESEVANEFGGIQDMYMNTRLNSAPIQADGIHSDENLQDME